jgi:hypothetical protein
LNRTLDTLIGASKKWGGLFIWLKKAMYLKDNPQQFQAISI